MVQRKEGSHRRQFQDNARCPAFATYVPQISMGRSARVFEGFCRIDTQDKGVIRCQRSCASAASPQKNKLNPCNAQKSWWVRPDGLTRIGTESFTRHLARAISIKRPTWRSFSIRSKLILPFTIRSKHRMQRNGYVGWRRTRALHSRLSYGKNSRTKAEPISRMRRPFEPDSIFCVAQTSSARCCCNSLFHFTSKTKI